VPESKRETVILNGVLKGMGRRNVSCTVQALKVSLPQLNVFEYIRCDFYHVPQDLPDGQYDLSFEGRTMQVNKVEGTWLSSGMRLTVQGNLRISD
jgi:hypothetical protein